MESIIPESSAQQLNILIVDDEPMLRSVIQEFLLMLGFERFQVAGDGLEALNRLRSEKFDCMISDIRMPEMELEEVLEVVKGEMPELVVIATSGYSDFSSASNIIYKGADDFLGKPLNLDSLELSLNWLAERRQLLQGARAVAAAPVSDFPSHVARLEPLLTNEHSAFPHALRHTLRLAQLLPKLGTDLAPEELRLLHLGSLVHELGLSCQLHLLCQQARRLEEQEYELILHSTRINGDRMASALAEPALGPMLGGHLNWVNCLLKSWDSNESGRRASVWLGLLNSVDGLLQDRPDRPGRQLVQVHRWLDERRKTSPLPPIDAVLDQWSQIERFYSHPAA